MNEMISLNPVLLIAVPLGLAFLTPLLGLISKKIAKWLPVVGFLFNLIVALSILPHVLKQPIIVKIAGFAPPFGINLFAGPVGMLLATLIALTGLLVAIYAMKYINEGAQQKYHILFLLLLTGATGVVLTGDIFNLFVFFEILCISSYALVAYLGNRAGIESAVKYLIQGSIGSSLLLIGIGLLYGQFGTLNMADLARQIFDYTEPSVFVPMVLMITGLGIEAAIFPLNAWLPDAHSSAPSSISAILSGIAIEVGLYAVIRVLFTIFDVSNFFMFFVFLGVLTILIGEMSAFSQKNIKRMLAYSSIGQIGLIVFAFSISTQFGVTGGLFQMISHTLGKALLFLSAGYMIYRTGSMEISSFEGIGKKMPLTALLFTIGTLSIIGLPPFIGFSSKFLIIKAALAKGELLFTILVAIVLLGTVIEGTYFFKVIQTMYFKDENKEIVKKESPVTGLIPMFIFAGLIIFIGIFPNFVMKILNPAASELLDKVEYIRSVLG
ncbi:MAG: proton-conducting transporter membrane subunit [Candidatus Marinimicrobia bacterium]|nr:proton-conducting transporter membrane subunit [Candidatus Neomarinimicrobiota bacterium]